jgi:fimbrial chaperone protein
MRSWTPLIFITGLICLASTPLGAASLQAAPTTFEMPAGKSADTLTLHNSGTTKLNAQVRLFRWTQPTGEDKSEPTGDVVASPPMVSIEPGQDQLVRLVRVSKRPVTGEETYRVVVDELPDSSATKSGMINFTFKYSIPMFFVTQQGAKSQLSWALEKQGDKTFIVARNDGGRRARIADLTLGTQGGKAFVLGKGLNGYVLAGSQMRWVLPSSLGSTTVVSVTARSDEGPINAEAQAQGSARR